MSRSKVETFSLYSLLSITTTDLPLSAGRIVMVSSFLKILSAFSSSFDMLVLKGVLHVLNMLVTPTRTVSLAVWLRLQIPVSIDDNIFETGTFFGVMAKLKPFMRAAISTGLNVHSEMLLTHLSLFAKLLELALLFPFN